MTQERIEKIIQETTKKLRKALEHAPEDITGSVTTNLRSGGVAGNLQIRYDA